MMRGAVLVLVLVHLVASSSSFDHRGDPINIPTAQVRLHNPSAQLLKRLDNAGWDLLSDRSVLLPPHRLDELRATGAQFEVETLDLTASYQKQLQTPYNASVDGIAARDYHEDDVTTESFIGTGSMGGYWTLSELEGHINTWAQGSDGMLVERTLLGTTLEGRQIESLCFKAKQDQVAPEGGLTAMHHAREPVSVLSVAWFVETFIKHHATDIELNALLTTRNVCVIPILNKDGYQKNVDDVPDGGGLHRKNTRYTSGVCDDNAFSQIGVDPNRNYAIPAAFTGDPDTGSSSDPCEGDYRGASPFSDPEAQAAREFCEQHDFMTMLNYHSYSNVLIHPWGFENSIPAGDDGAAFQEIGNAVAPDGYDVGTGIDTIGYAANGESDDYMYDTHGIFAFTPEVGSTSDRFWPNIDRGVELAQQTLRMSMDSMFYAGFYPELQDVEAVHGAPNIITFKIRNAGLSDSSGDVYYATSIYEGSKGLSGGDSGPKSIGPLGPRTTAGEEVELRLTIADGAVGSINIEIWDESRSTHPFVRSISFTKFSETWHTRTGICYHGRLGGDGLCTCDKGWRGDRCQACAEDTPNCFTLTTATSTPNYLLEIILASVALAAAIAGGAFLILRRNEAKGGEVSSIADEKAISGASAAKHGGAGARHGGKGGKGSKGSRSKRHDHGSRGHRAGGSKGSRSNGRRAPRHANGSAGSRTRR